MNESERRFAARAVRRKVIFRTLAGAGVTAAVLLAAFYGYRRWHDPGFPIGARVALIVMILLNARQNLRQYRYAGILEKLLGPARPRERTAGTP